MEIERETAESTRINLIVIGLPIQIKDRIDKEMIHSTDDFIRMLGQYEEAYHKKNFSNKEQMKEKEMQSRSVRPVRNSNPIFKKQPYPVCEALNFLGQSHLVEVCRNINKNAQKNFKQVNSTQIFTSENEESITQSGSEKKTKCPAKYEPLIKLRVIINNQKEV